MRDPRCLSIWKIGGRSERSSRLDAAGDADVVGRHAPRLSDALASTPMVAVGAVSDRRARLWLRTEATGPFAVDVWSCGREGRTAVVADSRRPEADGTMAFTIPNDAPAIGLLAPATAHRFRITVARTGELVGEGRFETAPAAGAGGSFAFAFMSCHQPFRPDGAVHPDAARMLAALEPALASRGVKYALLIGDQIYADAPGPGSLLRADRAGALLRASAAEIRARYQARYRQFWAFPELRRLQARWPTWCIWDDHEIVNDWGARRAHQRPAWRRVFEGARAAFVDYQASRTIGPGALWPSAFHQAFVWGAAATFIMDLSSERTTDGREARVYSDHQLGALTAFLRAQQARPVVFVVLSVPLVYLPDWLVALGERLPRQGVPFGTRWNAARNRGARDRLLAVLRAHQRTAPGQTLVLLSGDVHQGAAVALRWPDGARAYQFVSSPVTNAIRGWQERIAGRLSFSMPHVRHGTERAAIERLGCAMPGQRNPFNGLNVGIVSVEDRGAGAAVRFELVTYDAGAPGAARVAYDSGWL
ncbi:MAG TPA: alkaline phosphatase D family protein [Candidatus Tectomicrobia bacterium]|nr:alkaline phosphatase D family protein [Candidatus Tectomicrobia bacterium]